MRIKSWAGRPSEILRDIEIECDCGKIMNLNDLNDGVFRCKECFRAGRLKTDLKIITVEEEAEIVNFDCVESYDFTLKNLTVKCVCGWTIRRDFETESSEFFRCEKCGRYLELKLTDKFMPKVMAIPIELIKNEKERT